MITAAVPANESDRLQALYDLSLLDTNPEERFDRITKQAMARFNVPISTITLVDENREWFKSCQGLDSLEGPRDISFCGHLMSGELIMVIGDTLEDERFKDNPMVIGKPYIRFYAGVALFEKNSKLPVGVLCIKDIKPRIFSDLDVIDLMALGKDAELEINRKP